MKRFSVVPAEEREFEVAGEVFRWKYPYWEEIAAVFDQDDQQGEVELSVHATITDFIERIELLIDPDFNDGRNRWRALTKRKKDPIPHAQYAAIYSWLLGVASAPTPTEQPSPSEDGQQPIAVTSTGG